MTGLPRKIAVTRCLIVGIDEAGCGPLAGPVVAGAVILNPRRRIAGIDDSKKLSAKERERLAVEIKFKALAWSVAAADVAEIDALNILGATHLAMRRALLGLPIKPTHAQIDGNRVRCPPLTGLGFECTHETIVDGDALVPVIGAASILAKVARDAMMEAFDRLHPGYGFAAHKGYSTAVHFAALRERGPSPIHRKSFAPVREQLEDIEQQAFAFSDVE